MVINRLKNKGEGVSKVFYPSKSNRHHSSNVLYAELTKVEIDEATENEMERIISGCENPDFKLIKMFAPKSDPLAFNQWMIYIKESRKVSILEAFETVIGLTEEYYGVPWQVSYDAAMRKIRKAMRKK